jgi:hypothetical protein
MFKITSKHLLIGAALVGVYMIYKNKKISDWQDWGASGIKRVPTLQELNPNGGGSVFEMFPVGPNNRGYN